MIIGFYNKVIWRSYRWVEDKVLRIVILMGMVRKELVLDRFICSGFVSVEGLKLK